MALVNGSEYLSRVGVSRVEFEVVHSGCGSALKVRLPGGASVKAQSDALVVKSQNVSLDSRFDGGAFRAMMRSALSNESLFFQALTARTDRDDNDCLFAPSAAGDIILVEVEPGKELCVSKGCFLAADVSLDIDLQSQFAVSKALFGGGLFVMYLSGFGVAALSGCGSVMAYTLQPHEIRSKTRETMGRAGFLLSVAVASAAGGALVALCEEQTPPGASGGASLPRHDGFRAKRARRRRRGPPAGDRAGGAGAEERRPASRRRSSSSSSSTSRSSGNGRAELAASSPGRLREVCAGGVGRPAQQRRSSSSHSSENGCVEGTSFSPGLLHELRAGRVDQPSQRRSSSSHSSENGWSERTSSSPGLLHELRAGQVDQPSQRRGSSSHSSENGWVERTASSPGLLHELRAGQIDQLSQRRSSLSHSSEDRSVERTASPPAGGAALRSRRRRCTSPSGNRQQAGKPAPVAVPGDVLATSPGTSWEHTFETSGEHPGNILDLGPHPPGRAGRRQSWEEAEDERSQHSSPSPHSSAQNMLAAAAAAVDPRELALVASAMRRACGVGSGARGRPAAGLGEGRLRKCWWDIPELVFEVAGYLSCRDLVKCAGVRGTWLRASVEGLSSSKRASATARLELGSKRVSPSWRNARRGAVRVDTFDQLLRQHAAPLVEQPALPFDHSVDCIQVEQAAEGLSDILTCYKQRQQACTWISPFTSDAQPTAP
ncbi:hypothetical protein DIPPA_25624 [Diplonema papillatum]|nr:hypothetical protein DIPPA_25624 [Diplonema papillatum]